MVVEEETDDPDYEMRSRSFMTGYTKPPVETNKLWDFQYKEETYEPVVEKKKNKKTRNDSKYIWDTNSVEAEVRAVKTRSGRGLQEGAEAEKRAAPSTQWAPPRDTVGATH